MYLRLVLIGIGESIGVVVFAMVLHVLVDHAQHPALAAPHYALLYRSVAWMSTTGLLTTLILASTVTVVFKAIGPRMAERLAQDYVHRVRVRLFAHATGSDTMTAKRRGIGVTVLRFTGDSTALRGWAGTGLAALAVDGVFVTCTMAVLTVILPAAGIAAGAVLLACAGAALLLGRRLRSRVREARKQTGRLAAFVNERVTNAAVFQSLGRVGRERWSLSRRSRQFSEAMIRQAGIVGTLNATAEAARIGVLVAVIGAAVLVGARADTVTSLVSIASFLGGPLAALAQALESWQRSRIARLRITEVISAPAHLASEPATPPLPEGPGVLELSRVRLAGVLDDVSAVVPAGARVVVDGLPGSGKTLLLTAIAHLHPLDDGAILVDGADIAKRGAVSVGRAIRLVSPDLPLLRGTVAANLGHGEIPEKDLDEPTRARLAAMRCLSDRLEATLSGQLPDGLKTRVGEGGHGLSRVARYHVCLARAMRGAPRLLLLDWPEADSAECRDLLDDLFDNYPGTLICVTRDARLHGRADQRWHLDTTLTVRHAAGPERGGQRPAQVSEMLSWGWRCR